MVTFILPHNERLVKCRMWGRVGGPLVANSSNERQTMGNNSAERNRPHLEKNTIFIICSSI